MAVAFGENQVAEDEFENIHVEFDRSMAVFDGELVVATGGTLTFDLVVPGGNVAAGGLTLISVRPTHRRQGLLTDMIRYHFADCRARAEPLAMLWASESSIYGRFGYGEATVVHDLAVEARTVEFLEPVQAPGRTRFITPAEAEKLLPVVYERARVRPGMLSRSPEWWKARHLADPERHRRGYTAKRFVVYEEEGEALGFTRYRQKANWTDAGIADGEVRVLELIAETPVAYRALWSFLLNIDLSEHVKAYLRPVDEPLPWMLTDPRRVTRIAGDALWVRLLDIPAALSARRYLTQDRLVIEVHDPFLPEVGGRFELEGGPDGAECRPSSAAADVSLDVRDLARLYLGAGETAALTYAGRIEGSADAVDRAGAMFSWHQPPWCSEVF
jgi:predicted acetyltransferase